MAAAPFTSWLTTQVSDRRGVQTIEYTVRRIQEHTNLSTERVVLPDPQGNCKGRVPPSDTKNHLVFTARNDTSYRLVSAIRLGDPE